MTEKISNSKNPLAGQNIGQLTLEQIRIHPELKDFMPPLTEGEFALLECSILEEQCVREKLLLWESAGGEYFLLDGHSRFEVLMKHRQKGIKWEYKVVGKFKNPEEVRWMMCLQQMGRRNMTPFQQAYQRGFLYMKTKKAPHRPKGQRISVGKTKDLLAEQFKVSAATIERDAAFYKGVNRFADFYAEGETVSEKEKILRDESLFTKGDLEIIAKLNIFPEMIYRFKKLNGDLQLVLQKPQAERMLFMMTFCDRQQYQQLQDEKLRAEESERNEEEEESLKKKASSPLIKKPILIRRFDKWAEQQNKQINRILDGYSKQSLRDKRKELEDCVQKLYELIDLVGCWEAGSFTPTQTLE
jgi:hypothetical protein